MDKEGAHYDDGIVTYAAGTREALEQLRKADLMGFTLPRKYGGLNMPVLLYTIAIEMVSRADACLMNIFGLQDIAETIHAFADDALKDKYLPMFSAGEVTGAMVLTEPDAGSDLQARAAARHPGRGHRHLAPQGRQALHHQRLRRGAAGAGAQRAKAARARAG